MRTGITGALLLLHAGLSAAGAADGIVVELTGARIASFDRIVAQEIDLHAAAELLGKTARVAPQSIRVVEVGLGGEPLATVASQVDAVAGKPGTHTVCWQAPGKLGAGQTRKFKIVLDGKGPIPSPTRPVIALTDGANHHGQEPQCETDLL